MLFIWYSFPFHYLPNVWQYKSSCREEWFSFKISSLPQNFYIYLGSASKQKWYNKNANTNVASCVFRLKVLIVLIPWNPFSSLHWIIELTLSWGTFLYNTWKSWSDAYHKIIFLHNAIIYTMSIEFIDWSLFCDSLIKLYSFLWYLLSYII